VSRFEQSNQRGGHSMQSKVKPPILLRRVDGAGACFSGQFQRSERCSRI